MKSQSLKKKAKRKRFRIIIGIILIVLLLGSGGYFYSRAHVIMNKPGDLFTTNPQKSSADSLGQTPNRSEDAARQDSSIIQADSQDDEDAKSALTNSNIVNVLLLGIDRTPDGKTSSGTMAHADAVMVIAINFATKEVNLVSLPRDSFVNMPGVKGFYKLNCMFNVGGGYTSSNGGGFTKMCEAAQWLLGGVPINYYYSVDFEAIMELVDAIGGIDYEMDMDYTGHSGKHYQKGMQHLDGQNVLDYLRARRNATLGANDRERVNRQKRMMIAIFNKFKESNLYKTIPSILNSVKGGFYTNTNMEQTLAIANFARNIDTGSIGTYSLYGEYKAGPIAWNWTFIDPQNRVDVIQKVWGVKVSPLECTSYEFMSWLKDYGFLALKYRSNAELVEEAISGLSTLTAEQQAAYDKLLISYDALVTTYDLASHSLNQDDTSAMQSAMDDLQSNTKDLAMIIKYMGKLQWNVASSWCEDSGINEVYVDFR